VGLRRRAFLQQASLALGALGVGVTALGAGPSQYRQALAKPARRKLALLIGINQYPERAIDPILAQDITLKGCLTDVELQRQLLVHRFGFQPVDIVTLTNQQATRAGILEAIDQHLVQQAQGDEVVLLHFSGYGSQVRVEGAASDIQSAWVTVDSHLPSEEKPALADLLEREIIARLQPLATPNLTTVIDAGSQDMGYLRWGNLKVRSRPTVPTGTLPSTFAHDPATPQPWPGLLLRAGEIGNLVLEGQWDGFSAGVFTYALTQSLWETLPGSSPQIFMQRLDDRLQRWTGPDQHPSWAGGLAAKAGAAYFSSVQMPNADGVLLPPSGDERPLSLWLGGLAPEVLRYLQPGARLLSIPATGAGGVSLAKAAHALELRLESRTGLKALARPVEAMAPLPPGPQPVYEKVRLLPQSIALVVALDGQLKRVERVDATSALSSIPFVASITAGEKNADCLFGRLPLGPVSTLTATLPSTPEGIALPKTGSDRLAESSYGLFAPNRTLVPGTMLPKEEAVKTAINRLTPNLRSLLALKLVRLTQNRSASWLGATAALEAVQPKAKPLMRQQTERSSATGLMSFSLGKATTEGADALELSRDTRLLYRIANRCDQPLHLLVISFDSQGKCSALLVFPESAITQEITVADPPPPALVPRQTQIIPNTINGWGIPGAITRMETFLILSVRPFQRCLEVMGADGAMNPLSTDLRYVSQPLKLAQALLQDLHNDQALGDSRGASGDHYALSQDQWVTFCFPYTVSSV
jgi:hypothetical protein